MGLVAGLGSTLGEMTGYLAGVGGRSIVEAGSYHTKLEQWMRKGRVGFIFFLAAIPNPVLAVAGLMAGALRLPAWHFLLATWAGKSLRFGLLALSRQFFWGI